MARDGRSRIDALSFGVVATPGQNPIGERARLGLGAQGLAEALDRILSARLAREERAAEREGEAAGRAAALTNPATRMDPETVRGAAFNRAVIETGARVLETRLRERLDALARAHAADPAALEEKARDFITGMVEALPEDVRPALTVGAETILRPYLSQARREQDRAVADERLAAFQAAQARRLEAVTRNARAAAADPAAAAALAQDMALITEDLVALGPRHAFTFRGRRHEADPTRAGALSVGEMERMLAAIERETAEQAAMGAYERGPRTTAWIDGFEARARREGFPGLDQDGIDRVIARMRADAARRQHEADRARAAAEREARARERALAQAVREADDMILAGYMPPNIEDLIAHSRGTELAPVVDRLVEAGREVQAFRLLPAADQRARLETLQGKLERGEATPAEFAQFRRLAAVHAALAREAEADGLAAYHAQVVGAPPPPLDLGRPETLRERVRLAEAAAAHFGRAVAPLTAAEAAGLARRFREAKTAEERAALIEPFLDAPAPMRAAAIQLFERVRGEDGGLPPGTMALIADALRDPTGRPRALALLNALLAEAPKPDANEGPNLRTAVEAELLRGVPGVRAAAMAASGDLSYAALQARDRRLLEHLTRQRIAMGESAREAARAAATMLYGHLATIDREGFAHLYLPARVIEREGAEVIERGLTLLRARAAARVADTPLPETLPVSERALAERHRRDRARQLLREGTWINDGAGFALIAPGSGERTELRERVVAVPLEEVIAAGRTVPGAAEEELARIRHHIEARPAAPTPPRRPAAPPPSGREAAPMVAP